MQNNHKEETSALMQKTTELEDQVIKWDAYRDILLDGMSRRFNGLAVKDWWRRKLSPGRSAFPRWPRDTESKTQIQGAVLEILEAVMKVLDIMRQELEAMQESASVLSEKMDGQGFHGQPMTDADKINENIGENAKTRGVSMAVIAIAYVQSKPFISATILGMNSINRVDEAIEACQYELSAEEVESIDALYVPRNIIIIGQS
ncbi:hypothetical protein KCU67_g908, partial [Aureobasidium melanogenum]